MIEVYLSFPGNAREALLYYAKVFDAPEPYMMTFSELPDEVKSEMPPGMEELLMYGNLKTFAGDMMMSDDMPNGETPNSTFWVAVTHEDEERLRLVFNRLAEDGEVLMPLEVTFFSPLYGQVKDKFGYHWMLMLPDEL